MSNVVMPQTRQKENQTGKLLMVGGAALGAANPALLGATGMLGGAGAGAGLGGTAGSLLNNQKPKAEVPTVQTSAIQRRMDTLQASNDNVRALRDAESSLMALPPAQQAQYAPTIKKARSLAEQEIA